MSAGSRKLAEPYARAWMDVAGPSSIFRRSTRHEEIQLLRFKHLILGLTFPVIMALDVITKRWALDELATLGHGHELLGGLVPLTLAYNKGAAFGMRIGDDSRWFFIPVTILALVLLGVLYKQATDRDFLRISSISLVVSGAVGNLYDRTSPSSMWPTWPSRVAPCC